MTESTPRPESLDQKVARWLNFVVMSLLCLLLFGGSIWIVIDHWPSALAVVQGAPGAKSSDLWPVLGMASVALSLLLNLLGWFNSWRKTRRP